MKLKLALCQMKVETDKLKNLQTAAQLAQQAAQSGAQLICLPEMFCCPYDNACFADYAETMDGEIVHSLAEIARQAGCVLIGGSFPEREGGKLYNTSPVFSSKGKLLGRHRKLHLFDIDVEGGVRFQESDVLTAGNSCTLIDTEYGKIGVAICFDVRFPELFRTMALRGADLVFLPGAFNPTTGPAHWELTLRARALDNQLFVAACAPALDPDASYHSYGHSLVADPWGRVVRQLDDRPGILLVTIDLKEVEKVRRELPLLAARRPELYGCESD